MTTQEHLSDTLVYGGILTPRGEIYEHLMIVAKRSGAPNPQACAGRWMQAVEAADRAIKAAL